QEIISPFVLVDFSPIVFHATDTFLSQTDQIRTEISTLVNQVNADSVLWFIQNLQDFQTRYAFAPNRLAVATWIRDQFIRFGVSDSYLQPFQWNGTTQYNVVATIPGQINPDRFVIVGGHHDSIVNNGSPMTFAPGADDNATGTTAALEMARVMMTTGFQPKNSIRFVTFAAEEFGLWGSKHYAQDALESGQEIVLMINHDMIGHSTQSPTNWQVRLMPYDGSIQHSQYAAQLTQQYTTLSPTYGQMNLSASDSHSFWTRGYPVTYFFEQIFCPYYHSDLDIIEYVNGPYCAEVIRASVALASTYGMMVSAPGDVVVADTGQGNSLRVSWANSLDPDVVAYRVYYNTTGANFQNPVTVNPMTGENSWYNITGLTAGTTYYVAVSAIDIDGNESYMVYGQGTPNLIPLTPRGFEDDPGMGFVRLIWEPNQELDLMGYNLYKTATPGENEELLGGILTTEVYFDNDFSHPHDYVFYRLVAVDLAGNESPSTSYIRSRQVTLDKGILIVDETLDGSGVNPFQPTGAQVFEFVDGILSQYVRDHYDLEQESDLRLADIGIYKSIFWHGFDQSDFDSFYIYRHAIARYLELGGNLFFTSYYPTQAVELNSGYPVTFGSTRYINEYLGIGTADYTSASRFKYATPANQDWPALTVDPNKTTTSMNGHIFKVESIGAAAHAQ
ncbi:MAG: M20/M25/M40 family metallo-hydrolase, partial [Candidatus Cloacimonadaceae bacterium]|nr:M20/M25/M40 family metallo-hydrolase [Candidatus Cloacimonadaceae bacterium]